jgi:hypothetical protein
MCAGLKPVARFVRHHFGQSVSNIAPETGRLLARGGSLRAMVPETRMAGAVLVQKAEPKIKDKNA